MGLMENMLQEPVSVLALREPVCVPRSATIREAIQAMRRGSLGCAVVVEDDGRPVAMFTEAMIKGILLGGGKELDELVLQHVPHEFPWTPIDDPIVTVLYAMEEKNIRFIVVVDEEGRVAGLTGQKGLMEFIAEHFPKQVLVHRVGAKHGVSEREGA